MMTREQRILRIVSTLRPTDPGSWGPNTYYVTMEFNEHDAEQRQTIEQQAQEIARLREALEIYREASFQSHNGHWDMTMQHGAGCPECIRVRELRAKADHIVAQHTNLEGSAPCWNSAHMKQIATLREALEGILEIGKRDMTNPKYDVYFAQAQQALKEEP